MYADESPNALEDGIPDHAWETRFEAVGPLRPPADEPIRPAPRAHIDVAGAIRSSWK